MVKVTGEDEGRVGGWVGYLVVRMIKINETWGGG